MMINIQLTLNHEITLNLTLFFTHHNINMSFFKFLGRLLLVTALVSSAYHHLQQPDRSVEEFKTNYKTLDELSNKYLQYDLTFDNVLILISSITGAQELRFSDYLKPWWPA